MLSLIILTLLLSGCIGESTVSVIEEEPQAGFFYGVLHGLLFYLHLYQHIVGEPVAVYDLIHNQFYDFGFLSGLGVSSAALRLFLLNLPMAYFTNRMNNWVILLIGVVLGILICGGVTSFFVDSSSPYWLPRAWPEGVDTNDGFLLGIWHALISPWISFCNLLGYGSTVMSSQSTSYIIPFAFMSFLTTGSSKNDDDDS